jgi:hypothetical protein
VMSEVSPLLVRKTLRCGSLVMFQRKVLPPSSELKSM